jgi:hypothetical protein
MKNRKIKELLLILLVPLLFLIIGTAVIKNYGFNWDEPFHFIRGQAYLHYFLSGEKDYSSLLPYPRLNQDCPEWSKECYRISPGGATDTLYSDKNGPIYDEAIKTRYPSGFLSRWRSFYQNDTYDFDSIIASEGGHPALNDILAAFTNYVVFQRLHLLGDLESHHFFEVFTSFLLVLGVSIFVYPKLGVFPAVVAGASLALYPIFFSETHFNIKDPPEAAFFGLTIILFYFGIVKNNWRFIVGAAVFSALALGTKFNAVFIAPILGVWLIFYLITQLVSKKKALFSKNNIMKSLPVILSLIIFPAITLGIFYFTWPYLWSDPFTNIMTVINYYRDIGTGVSSESVNYMIRGWNTYPIIWIIYTTPIPILFLSAVGLISSLILIFRKEHFFFLVLIWFIVPILRVSLPGATIYGGIRQIMEFVPAMAILAGIGAWALMKIASSSKREILLKTVVLGVVTSLLFVAYEMYRIHPNENIYFNQLIGGLSGARERNIPAWGNTFGNVYLQGVNWLNENAEPNAKLGLAVSTMGNIPKMKLRTDIDFFNGHWSGPLHLGEYEMEMDFDWWPKLFYSFQYYDVFMDPVYKVEVDGVAVLKIWKNDIKYVKPEFRNEKVYSPISIQQRKGVVGSQLFIDLGKEINLTKVAVRHATNNCQPQSASGYISLSSDNKIWTRELDPIHTPQVPEPVIVLDDSKFVFLFAAKKARYILIDPQVENACLLKDPGVEITGLSETL